jgi:cytochrome c biogenesis protein CcmG, thiol:disulfide interchange protein DsbE
MSGRKAKQRRRQQAVPAPRAPRQGLSRTISTKWIAAGVVAVLVLAALIIGIVASKGNKSRNAPVVRQARNGAPVEIAGTDPVTGKHVDLASFAGKPIVLNIWASWCPGCNDEAADLRRFQEQHPNVQVVGIDINDSTKGAKGFYQRWGWKHPSIFDPKGAIAAKLGLQGLPTTYFLNRRHVLVTQSVGATSLAGFDQGLQAAIS